MGAKEVASLLARHPDASYRQIGHLIGVSRQRVGQVAKKASLQRGNRHYRRDVTVESVLNLYRRNQLVEDIAKKLGCSRELVRRRLRAAGISKQECYTHSMRLVPRGGGPGTGNWRRDITVESVLNLYHRNQLVKDIAPALGCNRALVRRRLRAAGISKQECWSHSMRLVPRGGPKKEVVTLSR